MQNAQQGMILGGDLYFDFLTASGASTGLQPAGNANRLIPKVESETLENKLNGRDTLGQTGDSYTRITSSTVSFSLNRYDPNIVAAFFLGSAVDISRTSGPYTATVVAIQDRWVLIGEDGLATCVVKDETDTTTYNEGDDYEVNLRLGMIRILSTGDIDDGNTLNISGNVGEATGSMITGATRPVINVGMLLDGKNYVTGANVKFQIWQAQIRGDGDFDLLAQGGFPELQFSGTMVTPAGKARPFEMK